MADLYEFVWWERLYELCFLLYEKIMESGYNPDVIIGVARGGWVPARVLSDLFFMPTHTVYYNRPIWGLVISTIFLAILFTWVYNNTNGSILAALLFHTIFNWSHYLFPVLETDLGATAFLVLQFVAVVVVVLFWGYKRLVRDETPDTGGAVD